MRRTPWIDQDGSLYMEDQETGERTWTGTNAYRDQHDIDREERQAEAARRYESRLFDTD